MPKKQRVLNQYARHNLSILTPIMISFIKRGEWKFASADLLKCTSCGHYRITGPIVRYFDYNPSKLLCYECQNSRVQNNQPIAVSDILTIGFNS